MFVNFGSWQRKQQQNHHHQQKQQEEEECRQRQEQQEFSRVASDLAYSNPRSPSLSTLRPNFPRKSFSDAVEDSHHYLEQGRRNFALSCL